MSEKRTYKARVRGGRVRRRAEDGAVESGRRDDCARASEKGAGKSDVCVGCGGPLLFVDETRLCPKCNSAASHELTAVLSQTLVIPNGEDRQLIECPGASLYDEVTGRVIEGADFVEHEAGVYEVKLVKHAVFPPGHRRKRMITREAFGKIRRCRFCQDYTVRMRRKEGVDFCVPSRKFPHRKKLKPVDFVSHRNTGTDSFAG